jgi:Kef-type K+ transport system membrane component KefB
LTKGRMLETWGIVYQLDILATIGLVITVAFLGSKLFRRVGIPQVVGFIVVGVLLGNSFLHIVPLELIAQLTFVSELALAAANRFSLYSDHGGSNWAA